MSHPSKGLPYFTEQVATLTCLSSSLLDISGPGWQCSSQWEVAEGSTELPIPTSQSGGPCT